VALPRLLNSIEKEFDSSDAEQLLKELGDDWIEGTEVTAEAILRIKSTLIKNNVEVEYHLVFPFIEEACYRLAQNNTDDDVAIVQAYHTTKRQHRSLGPLLETSDSTARVLLKVFDLGLAAIIRDGRIFDKDMEGAKEDQGTTATLEKT
jgi:hypothetical protein